jgi:ribonuclease HII
VAAAVVLPENCMIEGVDDSKKLTRKMRDQLDAEIKKQALNWSIGIIFPPLLDDINIYQATKLAMSSAIAGLTLRPDHLIIDAVKLRRSG